jgi:hypothetical protein
MDQFPMEKKAEFSKAVKSGWRLILFVSILGFMVCLAIVLVQYDGLKTIADLIAADGDLESFTPAVLKVLKFLAAIGSGVFVLIAGMLLVRRHGSLVWISSLGPNFNDFMTARKSELWNLGTAIRTVEKDRRIVMLVVAMTLLAALIRMPYLWKPMGHDETYTYIAFASRGLRVTMTDYHLPNNHVFHTILVFFASQLFGDSPAAIRLPAFLAGVLVVPLSFFVAKLFFDKLIALFSASVLAAIPVMIDYSTNARSYSLLAVLFLLLILVSAYVKDRRNTIAWSILVLISALGLYANPTMVYPIAVVFCWLVICSLLNRIDPKYGRHIYLYLSLSALSIVLIAGLLYLPIIVYSGIQALIGNNVIASLNWTDFYESVPARIRNTWSEWIGDLHAYLRTVGLFGLAASAVFPPIRRSGLFLFLAAAALSIGTILLVQRVAPWPRIWLFLLPIVVIWAVAGLIGFFRFIFSKFRAGDSFLTLLIALAVVFILSAGMVRSFGYFSTKSNLTGEVESSAVFLSGFLQEGDVVISTSPDTVVLKYYLQRHEIEPEYLEIADSKPFRRAIVLVNTAYGQSLETVLLERSFEDNVNPGTATIIYHTNRITLYLLPNG